MTTADRVFASWPLSGVAGLGVAGKAEASIDRVSAAPAARCCGSRRLRESASSHSCAKSAHEWDVLLFFWRELVQPQRLAGSYASPPWMQGTALRYS